MTDKRNISQLIRYEPTKITKKTKKVAALAKINERQYVNALQEILIKPLTRNENPLKKVGTN